MSLDVMWGVVEGGTTSVPVKRWTRPSVKTRMRPGKSCAICGSEVVVGVVFVSLSMGVMKMEIDR